MASTPVGSNALILEVLNRHNYKNWSSRVKTYLLAEDLWEVVEAMTEPAKHDDEYKAWTKKNAKALYAIQNSCGPEMFPVIRETETAKSAWEALERVSKLTGHVENSAENFKPYIPFMQFVSEGNWDKAKECVRLGELDLRSAARAIDPRDGFGDMALHVAARKGHVNIVKELMVLMTEEELKMKNAQGTTAIHIAAWNGQVKTVKELVLLMREEKDSSGNTALHIAVSVWKLDIVKELVPFMRQEDLKIKNNDGYTALHLAVNKGNVPVVKELGRLMGEVRDGNGDTALHIAIKNEQLDIVEELVRLMRPEDLAIKNDEGYTALHLAVNKGNVPILKQFVTKEGEDDLDRFIPFNASVLQGDWDKARECFIELDDPYDAITRVDPRDGHGDTVYHVVAAQGHVHILKELLALITVRDDLELKTAQDFKAFGSSVNLGVNEQFVMESAKYMVEQYKKMPTSILEVQNAEGFTALHLAVKYGNVDIVKELVSLVRKEGLEIKDADGDSPLHLAVGNENVDIVKELVPLMRKEGLEIKNADGDIALNKAVLKGHVDIVKELVQSMRVEGLEVKNNKGSNALHLAVMNGRMDIAKDLMLFMRKEALEEKNGEGYTALGWALNVCKDEEVMEIAKYMAEQNTNVFGIPTPPLNWIPVVTAYSHNSWDLCRYLYPLTPLEFLMPEHGIYGAQLIINFLRAKKLDMALDLIRRCPRLAISPTLSDYPPIMELARLHSVFSSGTPVGFWQKLIYSRIPTARFNIEDNYYINVPNAEDDHPIPRDLVFSGTSLFRRCVKGLLKPLGAATRKIDDFTKEEINIIKKSIFKAIEQGHIQFVTHMCQANPNLVDILDDNYRSIYHFAIECRQEKIYSLIYGLNKEKRTRLGRYTTKFNDTMLHSAGILSPFPQFSRIRDASLQMQKELQWFKEVEKIVPFDLHESLNDNHLTARDLFTTNHEKLMEEAEKSIKGTASSCTVVGSLIATMMFAAAFTIPGGNNDKTGVPMFIDKNLFLAFIVSDTISLVTSTTSVIIFLGLLTSRYAEEDFLKSLPRKMMIGLFTLFISIATLMIAFSSTLIIMLQGQYSWTVVPSILLGSVPIASFVWVQFPLLVGTFMSTYGPGIFDKKTQPWY